MKKIVILTGAGISAESGLRTFRDSDGLWEGYNVEDVATPEHAAEMSRLLPGSRLAIFPGYHGQYMGEILFANANNKAPDYFVAMVNEFLAEPVAGK